MNATAQPGLLFDWRPPRRRARALVIFIAGSLVLHALCFYIFQITYPPSVVLVPPPARVNLISNRTEDGRALSQWLDAEDPALISTTMRASGGRWRELPRLEHVPSYMNERVTLKQLPPLDIDLKPPSVQPPRPVPTSRRIAPVKPAAPGPTTVEFSEEISALGTPTFPQSRFVASGSEQPANIRFRIAINARGEVQYAFASNSSGDAALDAQARAYIAQTRFAPAPNELLTWGIATLEFGGDVARSTSTPAP